MKNASFNEIAKPPAEPIIFLRARGRNTRPSRDLAAKLLDITPGYYVQVIRAWGTRRSILWEPKRCWLKVLSIKGADHVEVQLPTGPDLLTKDYIIDVKDERGGKGIESHNPLF
jgi:hypothetical protein